MALSRQQSEIWQAMNVGVQWVLRDGTDPLAPEPDAAPAARHAAAAAHPEPASETAAPTTTIGGAAPRTPCAPGMVRRGPMATRLRRQQQAAQAAANPPADIPASAPAVPVERAAPPMPSLKPQTLRPAARAPIAAPAAKAPAGAQPDPQITADLAHASWEDIKAIADRCHACPMACERTRTVVADGAPGCPMVLVGEAPGREEDLSGVPFVGNSGKLLTAILEACSLARGKDVAICNVLKCRPPGNRDPRPDEVAACAAFLDRQLELLAPKVLLLMGKHAASRLLGETKPISQLRGRVFSVTVAGRQVPAVVTYHPSYLLRNSVAKELGWHDILFAKKQLSAASDTKPE